MTRRDIIVTMLTYLPAAIVAAKTAYNIATDPPGTLRPCAFCRPLQEPPPRPPPPWLRIMRA